MFDASPPPTHDACPFCDIAAAHQPYDPLHPPSALSAELTSPSSFVVLSTPALIAFLDIMPLSPGHLLLCPRPHRPKLTDASPPEARELGAYVRVLSAALARATGVEDWNVVQNNGAAAAQVVPHMHFHLIPRPEIRASGRFRESFTMFGRGRREELDDDEAERLAEEVRRQVAAVLKEDQQQAEYEERRQLAKAKAKL
ncbi:Nitrilase and fragile histidine triad fusion protein NitFhit [Tolypocladium paradoxum]|uniref:Nitrilase and fragile histidine triad fusion protein NitFhit n=1 Tax=Tolypocladium paradoxum TaxID=94208 RepID=A0A2S4KWV3_9HYPO|nr:Nitrilase and fragile histidine triad fusion protein NitFhit [Tolypocladium paradoxum]